MTKKILLITVLILNLLASEPMQLDRVLPLTTLSAICVARNLLMLKDDIIEADNHDVTQLILQQTGLYKPTKKLKLRDTILGLTQNRLITGMLQREYYKSGCNQVNIFDYDGTLVSINHVRRINKILTTPCANFIAIYCGDNYLCDYIKLIHEKTGEVFSFHAHLRKYLSYSANPVLFGDKYILFHAHCGLLKLINLNLESLRQGKAKDLVRDDTIKAVAINADGTRIAVSTYNDKILYLWDDNESNSKPIKKIKINENCERFVFSSDGNFFACPADNALYIFDKQGKLICNLGKSRWFWQDANYSRKMFTSCMFSADGNRLIAGSIINEAEYFITIFDIKTKSIITEYSDIYSDFRYIKSWGNNKFFVENSQHMIVAYNDFGKKLFEIRSRGDLWCTQVIDEHTLLIENDDSTYTIRNEYGYAQQVGPYKSHTISPNGSRIVFETPTGEQHIYEKNCDEYVNNLKALYEMVDQKQAGHFLENQLK